MRKVDYYHAMPTPWGKADSVYKITNGVYDVSTPSHGGILVGKRVAYTLLSEKARRIGWLWSSFYAFEEDCDWAAFAYEQPELYSASFRQHSVDPDRFTPDAVKRRAEESLRNWHPDYFEK